MDLTYIFEIYYYIYIYNIWKLFLNVGNVLLEKQDNHQGIHFVILRPITYKWRLFVFKSDDFYLIEKEKCQMDILIVLLNLEFGGCIIYKLKNFG